MQRKLDRKEQLAVYQARYQGRAKEGKHLLLNEFCEHHGYERKYAIKLLGRLGAVSKRRHKVVRLEIRRAKSLCIRGKQSRWMD